MGAGDTNCSTYRRAPDHKAKPLMYFQCLSVCLQDEVAHTVTESRVLQNTRHPFLTVSRSDLSISGQPSASPREGAWLSGQQLSALDPWVGLTS